MNTELSGDRHWLRLRTKNFEGGGDLAGDRKVKHDTGTSNGRGGLWQSEDRQVVVFSMETLQEEHETNHSGVSSVKLRHGGFFPTMFEIVFFQASGKESVGAGVSALQFRMPE